MPFSHIQFEALDGIAQLTITRPEKRNSLNRQTLVELREALAEAAQNKSIKAVIVTGAGDKAFAAGADIKELAGTDAISAEELSRFGQETFRTLETMRKPSVAAINGVALGGGLELAMCCTVRFAAPEALLGQPEVKLGTLPGYGATQRLPQLIGRGRALEMLLSAEPVTAAEAFRLGLVNRVVPAGELLSASRAWLVTCLANGPYAVGLTMEAVDAGFSCGLEAGLRYESAAFGLIASTQERGEGVTAFLDKRSPQFSGK